jgi:glycosyltransferase involved in cell wall biosynthesis
MKIDNPKISVIMPSYLGDYPNAAKDRETKFRRAIISFLDQDYQHKELIIVSDGCEITDRIFPCLVNYGDGLPNPRRQEVEFWESSLYPLKLVRISKQPLFSGNVRNAGIQHATGEIITYLDTDDIIQRHHLKSIVEQMGDYDWVYYDDWVATESLLRANALRGNHPTFGHIGTSSISHKSKLIAKWSDGYGHDWKFVEDLLNTSKNYTKIKDCGYVVCHVAKRCDF